MHQREFNNVAMLISLGTAAIKDGFLACAPMLARNWPESIGAVAMVDSNKPL